MQSMLKDLEKDFLVKCFIATLCLFLIFAASAAHSQYMNRKISDMNKTYLLKMTTQNAELLSSQIRERIQPMQVLSRMMSNQQEFHLDKMVEVLEVEGKDVGFISVGVVLKDGSFGFTPLRDSSKNGSDLLIPSDWEYLNKTMTGDQGSQTSPAREIDGQKIRLYARPVYRDLQTIGVLAAFYSDELFDELNLPSASGEGGSYYLIDKDGCMQYMLQDNVQGESPREAIADTADEISQGWMLKGAENEKLKNRIRSGLSGSVLCGSREKLYLTYVPVDFQDFYLVNLMPADAAEAQTKGIYDNLMPAFFYVLIILMTLVLYLVYLRHQKLKRIERRMRLQSINDESYRMIMEHTNDIIFEYDTLEKTYLHTANFKKTFGYEPSKSGFLGSLEYDYIHPEDVVPFVTMFEGMSKENALTEAEVRIVNAEGEYLWTRIYTLGIFDKDGKPAKIIGKIININEEKRELEQLQEKAVMDFSSGVLNKQTTEQMIRSFLSGEGKLGRHALFIVDIDDFKGINDDYGHRLGDAVISALGCELNQIFRNSDIKGRIGGDEFMILMKDIEDTESIAQKASAICSTFHRREVEPGRQIPLSTSIGIALYDRDGSSFEELYEAADQALYNCKNIEKGTFTFWEDNPAQ
ncbi:MAG: hypothetical protein K0R19_473 [Bacillota bacterium]|nr:hypothetical protein [Bacillota bacterium]